MEITAEQLEDLIVQATERATQNVIGSVAKMRNRKTVLASSMLSFIVGCLLAIPTTIILDHENAVTAKNNSFGLCKLQAEGRPVGNARAFVEAITLELAEDAFRVFPKQFRLREVEKINKELSAEQQFAPGELPKHVSGITDLAKVIQPLPLIDCESQVKD